MNYSFAYAFGASGHERALADKFGFGGGQNYVAVLAAKGYAVLQPNYRGSSGYGDDFMLKIVPHIVSAPGLDILTGVDALVKDGIADLGGTIIAGSPANFGKLIANETQKWAKVIQSANIA